jgi:uncharacterized oxidoreductase
MRLQKNKIIVTGATSGIGEVLAKTLTKLDNQVVAIGRNKEKLEVLNKLDKRIFPFRCDITKSEDIANLASFIENKHADTNILINNAAIQYNYQFTDEQPLGDKIEHEINTNFTAPVQLIAILLPTLVSNPNAAIVNVTSGLGLVPKRQAPVYCGTKAALHIFSQSLRYQLQQVKVFELISPLVDTPMTAGRGQGKIPPEQLVEEFIRAFQKDHFEIYAGKVKWLKLINRISPSLAANIMKKGGEN